MKFFDKNKHKKPVKKSIDKTQVAGLVLIVFMVFWTISSVFGLLAFGRSCEREDIKASAMSYDEVLDRKSYYMCIPSGTQFWCTRTDVSLDGFLTLFSANYNYSAVPNGRINLSNSTHSVPAFSFNMYLEDKGQSSVDYSAYCPITVIMNSDQRLIITVSEDYYFRVFNFSSIGTYSVSSCEFSFRWDASRSIGFGLSPEQTHSWDVVSNWTLTDDDIFNYGVSFTSYGLFYDPSSINFNFRDPRSHESVAETLDISFPGSEVTYVQHSINWRDLSTKLVDQLDGFLIESPIKVTIYFNQTLSDLYYTEEDDMFTYYVNLMSPYYENGSYYAAFIDSFMVQGFVLDGENTLMSPVAELEFDSTLKMYKFVIPRNSQFSPDYLSGLQFYFDGGSNSLDTFVMFNGNEYVAGLQDGAGNAYNSGYGMGIQTGTDSAYNSGLKEGLVQGEKIGIEKGKIIGANNAEEYSFSAMLAALIDVPVQAIVGLLNFNVLGINLGGFFFSLFSVCIVLVIVKLVRRV